MNFKGYLVQISFIVLLGFLSGCREESNNRTTYRTLSVNKAEIYYRIIGQGSPVVIVHGGPGLDHRHMLDFENLTDEYQVIGGFSRRPKRGLYGILQTGVEIYFC